MSARDDPPPLVLVTGATGYVGGRLVSRLLLAGFRVRCLVRDPVRLQSRSWFHQVQVVQADVLLSPSLMEAMEGVDTAYFLICSMREGADFHRRDLAMARNFGTAAREAGLRRIIYLGGLGNPDTDLSPHLRSRHRTGEVLRGSGVPVTELRAAVIVGSGSASFEMLRYLCERLPVIFLPSFLSTKVQPIAIRNVLEYLIAALMTPASTGKIIEIGGSEVLTYKEMIAGYAAMRGLRRPFVRLPLLTPGLCAMVTHLITPIDAQIARPLFQGARNEVVVRDDAAARLFPHIRPMNYDTMLNRALYCLNHGRVETAWSDALVTSEGDIRPVVLSSREGNIVEKRQLLVDAPPQAVFRSFCGLGGKHGWLYFNWAWRIRGAMDRMVGGVGLRRGRRDPHRVRVGEALDFFRVEAVEPDRLLRLRAEMRVPGEAWFQFEAEPQGPRTLLVQTAYFAPRGVLGLFYWYLLYPIHSAIFSGLIRKLALRARFIADRAEPRLDRTRLCFVSPWGVRLPSFRRDATCHDCMPFSARKDCRTYHRTSGLGSLWLRN